jgi:D-amino-acid dehydrogenase
MEEIGCFMLYKNPATEKHEIELAKDAKALNIETRIFNAAEVRDGTRSGSKCERRRVVSIDAHLHPGDLWPH